MDAASQRERLYEVFADSDSGLREKVDRALAIGTGYLDLPIGFFTRIEDGTQRIVQAIGDHELIQPGETCPLQDAYCRRTVAIEGTLAVQDAATSSIDERVIETFDLGAYIGAKVTDDDELYGTICFADHEPRDHEFSEAEELFLEVLANLVGTALERRAYERKLREQNQEFEQEKRRFEAIAENSFDIIFRVDLDARFTYVSSAVERVLDYRPEALTGSLFTEFMTDEAAAAAGDAYQRILDGEPVENLELDFLDRAGEVVVVEVNATPISEGEGITGVQGVGRDVTARKEQERELRMKTRAMDEATVGISMSDPHQPDAPLIYVNDGFERITGYDAEAALGRNCRFLQGAETDPDAIGRLSAAIDAEESLAVELVNYRRDGTPFWNRVRLNPVFDDAGDLSHYLGFQQDVTGRKRTGELVRLLNRVLRHNLRNDMTAVLGWAQLLQEGDANARTLGERIEEKSQELVELSEHARTLERLARRDREPRRLDPGSLLADVADAHRDRFPNANIEVRVGTDRGVCAGAEVEQALSELVENAVKHNPAAEPSVRMTATDEGEWIEVVVADDGPGLGEMEASVISSGEETALVHGSGLGLWLMNWIVTRYGGSFQIEADDDGGTTATVRLPSIEDDVPVETKEQGPTVLFH